MQVLLAQPRGFCAGVERAISIVEMALEKFGAPIYVRHEIVHNPHVVKRLKDKGVIFVEETDEVPDGSVVIFSAHGVTEEVENHAKSRNLKVIDATCPLVSKVHTEGKRYAKQGYEIILIGHKGHPEIEGTLGRISGVVHLVSDIKDVAKLQVHQTDKLAYITQTTLSIDDTKDVIDALKARFPSIIGPATKDICYATQNRQGAVRELAEHVDVVLVIGAHNSSNSNRLRERAEEKEGVKSYLIEDASKLDEKWVKGKKQVTSPDGKVVERELRVGITAGASAPEDLVQELIERLKQIGKVEVSILPGVQENVHFHLPTSLTKAEPLKAALGE
ncbi:MAG: 4-hydroxy-3-methylbut-2-enyl diphosphate reductase [Alphaproteobacteria bacterium]|nr:4-hydroxy-3-methylbut-2-enyl diphosphate reductase [Alphaproteobacteria bacterium]